MQMAAMVAIINGQTGGNTLQFPSYLQACEDLHQSVSTFHAKDAKGTAKERKGFSCGWDLPSTSHSLLLQGRLDTFSSQLGA